MNWRIITLLFAFLIIVSYVSASFDTVLTINSGGNSSVNSSNFKTSVAINQMISSNFSILSSNYNTCFGIHCINFSDIIPPALTVVSPKPVDKFIDNLPLEISAVDETGMSSVWYSIFNSDDVLSVSNTTFLDNLTVTGLGYDSFYIWVYANDTNNNINSVQVYFSIVKSQGNTGYDPNFGTKPSVEPINISNVSVPPIEPTPEEPSKKRNLIYFIIGTVVTVSSIICFKRIKKKRKIRKLILARKINDEEEKKKKEGDSFGI